MKKTIVCAHVLLYSLFSYTSIKIHNESTKPLFIDHIEIKNVNGVSTFTHTYPIKEYVATKSTYELNKSQAIQSIEIVYNAFRYIFHLPDNLDGIIIFDQYDNVTTSKQIHLTKKESLQSDIIPSKWGIRKL